MAKNSRLDSLGKRIASSFLWLLLWHCQPALAGVKVVDQNGQPVANAVVSYPSNEPNKPNDAAAIMDQVDKQFVPYVLAIAQHQKVSFPNSDNIRHHVYSFSEAKPFEIKMFKGGESKALTFEQAGIVVLGCNIHDQMIGYIYVAENEQYSVTNPQGLADIEIPTEHFYVWHPRLSNDHHKREKISQFDTAKGAPIAVSLNLLEEPKAATQKRTFRSRKFSRQGNKHE